jgi:hypothetical protein
MIDPSMDTVEVSPEADLRLKVLDLEQKIVDLTNKAAAATDNWEYARDRLQSRDRQVNELEDFLKSNHSDMDSEHVEEIAGIFGISLTVDYDVTINVTLSGTITVPMDYDIDDLESDLQASITTGYYGNSDIDIDVSEDHMDIDYTIA